MSPARIQLPHHYRSLDPAIRRELVDHAAADGFPISGVLYLPPRGEPDVCVVAIHPRVDFSRHYLYPVGPEGEKLRHPQERAADEIVLPWLRQRWPTS